MRRLVFIVLLVPSLAYATSSPNIYSNTQNYPLGSRAAGMGGAYTALACDEAAIHYNPAALGCAHTRLEIAANVYMLQHFAAPNAFGPGHDVAATSYHPLPSIAGFTRILNEGDRSTGEGTIGLGLSVSVPQSLFLVVNPPDPSKADTFAISVRDDLLEANVGGGWQITPELALGLAFGGAMRTAESHSNLLLVRSSSAPCGEGGMCFDFLTSTSDEEIFAIGGRAKIAARWTPTRELSFGLVLTSPSIDIYGSSKLSQSVSVAISFNNSMGQPANVYGVVPTRATGSSSLSLPGRIAIGAALSLPQLVLSVDLSANMPRTARIATGLTKAEVEGTPNSVDPIPDATLKLEFQPNINAGVEIPLTRVVILDFGFFTDFSSTSQRDLVDDSADKIHMFGGSMAIGLIGRQARSWFGLSFEGGSGTTRVRSSALDFDAVAQGATETMESSYSRWNLVGVLGSSYTFIDDEKLPPEEQ